MSQEITLADDRFAFAKTANAAVRRQAFEQVGGFKERVRSGGHADICFRIRAAGWELERREQATIVHRNRQIVPRIRSRSAATLIAVRILTVRSTTFTRLSELTIATPSCSFLRMPYGIGSSASGASPCWSADAFVCGLPPDLRNDDEDAELGGR